jgi:iduronate 2-sulfatase
MGIRFWLAAGVLFMSAWSLRAAERPNVLLICVDDLKPMLGCYGDATVKSPNIDALANRGILFNRAYCNQAVCAPSRNALLTGFRSTTLGIYDLATNFRYSKPNAVTLPQYFKQNGYRTEGMGKIFHYGHGNHEDQASWSVPFWRAEVVNYALPEHADANKNSREAALFNNVSGKKAKDLAKGVAYESADVPDNTYPDGKTADEAIKRLASAAKDPKQPFFLAVGFVKPHLPFCAPKKYWDLYDPSTFKLAERHTLPDGSPSYAGHNWAELRNYAGMPDEGPVPDDDARKLIQGYHAAVSFMDAQVGRVLAALKQDGFADNTIVVLWGDHGWHLGDHGLWCKHTNFEEAAHIPFMVFDPRAKGIHGKTDSMVESVDLYPTLCQLAGLPIPKGLDGKSFAQVLEDPTAPTKDCILHCFPRGGRLGRAVRTPRYRLVEWKFPGQKAEKAVYELYDYEVDPGENKNLASDKPEVVKELKAILAKQPEAKPQIHPTGGPKPANAAKEQSGAGTKKSGRKLEAQGAAG